MPKLSDAHSIVEAAVTTGAVNAQRKVDPVEAPATEAPGPTTPLIDAAALKTELDTQVGMSPEAQVHTFASLFASDGGVPLQQACHFAAYEQVFFYGQHLTCCALQAQTGVPPPPLPLHWTHMPNAVQLADAPPPPCVGRCNS